MKGILFEKRYLEIGDRKHTEMNYRINMLVNKSKEYEKSGEE